jgi:hypothetical protein
MDYTTLYPRRYKRVDLNRITPRYIPEDKNMLILKGLCGLISRRYKRVDLKRITPRYIPEDVNMLILNGIHGVISQKI